MSRQTLIFSLLFGLMFGWNCYLTYTLHKDFKDCALAISAIDNKINDLDSNTHLDEIIEANSRPRPSSPFQSDDLEMRIQSLESQTNQQQNKINDVERDAYWARSELNNQKNNKGQLYKWATDKENQLLNP